MKDTKKVKILLSLMMIIGIFTSLVANTTNKVNAETNIEDAPANWAFKESSILLHDAILAKYPGIDGCDGSVVDGYISKSEAAVWNGTGGGIQLNNQNIGGTIDGIEYFTSIQLLYIRGNQFTGTIPVGIKNMSLVNLDLANNELTGVIPDELYSVTTLKTLVIHGNLFSGEISPLIGNLINLTRLSVGSPYLGGTLPSEIGLLQQLKSIGIGGSNFSGEFPKEILELPNLTILDVKNNPLLEGNFTTDIPSTSILQNVNISGTNIIQAQPNVSTLDESNGGIFTYDNLSEALLNNDQTGPADGLTQEDIDRAQKSANYWSEPTKSEWQDNIDLAQNMLDAQEGVGELLNDTRTDVLDNVTQDTIDDAKELIKNLPDGQFKTDLQADIDLAQEFLNNRTSAQAKVDALFTDSTHEDIKDITNQDTINDALAVVNALPDGSFKENLLAEVAKAQNMFDAKAVVENLFTDSTHTDIKDTTDQAVIDNAKIVVNKLPDGKLKTELMAEIDKAQDMLNAKNAVGDLLDDDGKLSDGVTQEDIDNAQDLVNKLPNGDLKDKLQDIIDDAQKQLDELNKVPVVTNPSTPGSNPPVVSKPSISGETSTTTDVTKNVNTGDTTNLSLYGGLLLLSLCGFVVVTKRRKTVK